MIDAYVGFDLVLDICYFHSKYFSKSRLSRRTPRLIAFMSDFNSFANVRSKSVTFSCRSAPNRSVSQVETTEVLD